jgi:hypothetical protein
VKASEQYLDCLVLVDELFKNWKLHFGSKLKERQELDLQTARLWSIALALLEVTEIEFEIAFTQSLIQKWPPTAPADFVALARLEASSHFPDSYTAYISAANNSYIHPVCHATAVRVGLWRLRSEDTRFVYPSWKEAYQIVCNEFLDGAIHIQPVSHQIENKSQPRPASVAISSDYTNKISLLLAGEKNDYAN